MASPEDFIRLLEQNESVVVVYISATWCAPCKKITPYIESKLRQVRGTVVYLDLDRDFELCSALKRLKQFKGVPTLLAYKAGNILSYKADGVSLAATHSISGGVPSEIDYFFNSL
jgi:thioredoxin-like negative regulator of GroEL